MKVAVITGAGSGLGRAMAIELAAAGFRVVLAGRRKEALEETATAAPGAVVIPADVSEPESVTALFAEVERRCGRVDVLVNNAGIGKRGDVGELPYDDWSAVLGTNLTGSFLCAQEAFRLMREQGGGRIINNGSIAAHSPRPDSVAYTATKHAITGLTKSISLDGRQYNIACGQIDIGNAVTEMTDRMSSGVPQPNGSIMAEPTMDPQNVAEAVRYMAELPLNANVQFLTIMATGMPFIGRG